MSPGEFAQAHGWSERAVRKLARDIGACHVLGKTMDLTDDDVKALLEATKCPSKSSSAAISGTTGARLPDGDYEALRVQRTRQLRRVSRRRSKPDNGKVISMAQHRS